MVRHRRAQIWQLQTLAHPTTCLADCTAQCQGRKKLKRRWKKGKKIWLLMGNSFNKVCVGVFRGHSGHAEPVTVSKNTTMFDIFLYHEDERTSSRPVAASTTSFPLGRGHLFRRKNVRNQQRLLLRYACTANNCSVIS